MLGIVVEVQLSRDNRKRFVWPAYVVNLRARLKCPVVLLVVAGDEKVARWAARPIDIGGGFQLTPLVLSPSGVPIVDADTATSVRIVSTARAAIAGLDDGREQLYLDLIMTSLSEAARQELRAMDPANYQFLSGFAKDFIARGKAEGKVEGRAEGRHEGRADLIIRQLTLRFGTLPADVESRLTQASIEELDAVGERLLTAASIDEALSAH